MSTNRKEKSAHADLMDRIDDHIRLAIHKRQEAKQYHELSKRLIDESRDHWRQMADLLKATNAKRTTQI